MKKRIISLVIVAVLAAAVVFAVTGGGTPSDPLISLSHLQNVFAPKAEAEIDSTLDAADQSLYERLLATWRSAASAIRSDYQNAVSFTEIRLSEGDVISGPTGLQVIPVAGDLSLQSVFGGTVVDATDGSEVAADTKLTATHRYLTAEDAVAAFQVTSRTAVFNYCGNYKILRSDAPDYEAIADALHALGGDTPLFRGTDYAFGNGYELERAPTRMEALIMLIRLLGEEKDALACTDSHPFTDVPDWANPYAAYAYKKGYSNGISDRLFGTGSEASAQMYVEFILRALGYSSTAQTDISDALDRAVASGILNDAERRHLQSGTFFRADVAYLSYYALSAPISGSRQTLSEKLIAAGTFTKDEYRTVQKTVTSNRIS